MSSLILPNSCRLCGHCEPLKDNKTEGECHGAPPQVVAILIPGPNGQPAINVQTLFPRVQLDWHCGMWKPKIAIKLQ